MSKNKDKLASQRLSSFLNFLTTVEEDYRINYDTVNQTDKETQDYLHQLELGTPKARAKTATALAHCRQRRREAKDIVGNLEPLYDFIVDPENKPFIQKLKRVLGETRKAEKIMTRYYYPRVVEDLEFVKEQKNGKKTD